MFLVFSKHDPYFGYNAGFVALCLNLAVTVVVSMLAPAQPNRIEENAVAATVQQSAL